MWLIMITVRCFLHTLWIGKTGLRTYILICSVSTSLTVCKHSWKTTKINKGQTVKVLNFSKWSLKLPHKVNNSSLNCLKQLIGSWEKNFEITTMITFREKKDFSRYTYYLLHLLHTYTLEETISNSFVPFSYFPFITVGR